MGMNLLKSAKDDGDRKRKKNNKQIDNNYGIYQGVIDKKGKPVDRPTVDQSAETMANYMKNNTPESNVYRPKFSHLGIAYDRKKKQKDA